MNLLFMQLVALGAFILYFGFFAFNAGSQASISEVGDAAAIGLAAANTIISGACGAIVAMITQHFVDLHSQKLSRWSVLSAINGGLTGMVRLETIHPLTNNRCVCDGNSDCLQTKKNFRCFPSRLQSAPDVTP